MARALQPEDLNPWFYPVTIGGKDVMPGIYPEGEPRDRVGWQLVVRQNLRRLILVGEVTKRVDFKGLSILDVACNCAFWSSIYIQGYGADHVIGIEGRERYVQQARMLFQDRGLEERGNFLLDDVMTHDYAPYEKFDFVLCAGLLYHVNDHEGLLTKLASVDPKYILIDTRVWPARVDHKMRENPDLHFNSIEVHPTATIPTRSKIETIMRKLGYRIDPMPVPFHTVTGIDKGDDYNNGHRVTLLCTKR
jgi:SAM-dependent methyltransferase